MRVTWIAVGASVAMAMGLGACSGYEANESIYGSADLGASPDAGGGSFSNVGVGGAQDFAEFRSAIERGQIPREQALDAAGFFAEHYTSLPDPTCAGTFCLHGLLAVSPDLVHGGDWTLLQMAMNSPVDPATVTRPRLDLAVVLDHSGSMQGAGKLDYAKLGVERLIDQMREDDRFTLIQFDDEVETLFGPGPITDKAALKAIVQGITADGGTNIYDALEAGFKAALDGSTEAEQRRVIFLTDGIPTAGNTDPAAIRAMSAGYAEQYVGLTTVGVGSDVGSKMLRDLSERGGGNYYFLEDPAAATEVFTEELAFFVAPIAYDVDLTLTQVPTYDVKEVYGSSLWQPQAAGGTIHVPSVFLVSRASTAPGPSGGRRGGGSAIIAELKALPSSTASLHSVAHLQLSYRRPGEAARQTETVDVLYDGIPGAAPAPPSQGFFATPGIHKNSVVLAFFVAFRDATKLANQGNRTDAASLMDAFLSRVEPIVGSFTDEDLADDLAIARRYLTLLNAP